MRKIYAILMLGLFFTACQEEKEVQVDEVNPTLNATGPDKEMVWNTIEFSYEAEDDVELEEVTLSVAGTVVNSSIEATGTLSVNTQDFEDGIHDFVVEAKDVTGNTISKTFSYEVFNHLMKGEFISFDYDEHYINGGTTRFYMVLNDLDNNVIGAVELLEDMPFSIKRPESFNGDRFNYNLVATSTGHYFGEIQLVKTFYNGRVTKDFVYAEYENESKYELKDFKIINLPPSIKIGEIGDGYFPETYSAPRTTWETNSHFYYKDNQKAMVIITTTDDIEKYAYVDVAHVPDGGTLDMAGVEWKELSWDSAAINFETYQHLDPDQYYYELESYWLDRGNYTFFYNYNEIDPGIYNIKIPMIEEINEYYSGWYFSGVEDGRDYGFRSLFKRQDGVQKQFDMIDARISEVDNDNLIVKTTGHYDYSEIWSIAETQSDNFVLWLNSKSAENENVILEYPSIPDTIRFEDADPELIKELFNIFKVELHDSDNDNIEAFGLDIYSKEVVSEFSKHHELIFYDYSSVGGRIDKSSGKGTFPFRK